MGRVCSLCKRDTGDVTTYEIKSIVEVHTLWNLDMCIDCRNKVFGFIESLCILRKSNRLKDPHGPDGGEY